MTRAAWCESVGGVSGDMLLGALVGCGLEWEHFVGPLIRGVPGLRIEREEVRRLGMAAWRVWCHVVDDAPVRKLNDVTTIIQGLALPSTVRESSVAAFIRLAEAESSAHGEPIEAVHFHEVGALDSIMDVVGFFWGLHLLGVDVVVASPLCLGSGFVDTSHGVLPVPVPAVAHLVRGVPVAAGSGEGELTTPTGALLVTSVARSYGPLPSMRVLSCGVGAGSRETSIPNVHRIWIGELTPAQVQEGNWQRDRVVLLETNLDDVTGEVLGFLREGLEALGAVDVTVLSGVGKKGRPVHVLRVLVPVAHRDHAIEMIVHETPALGVRVTEVSRVVLERRFERLSLPDGEITVKHAVHRGKVIRTEPEYDDCAALARATGRTLVSVMTEARTRGRPTPKE